MIGRWEALGEGEGPRSKVEGGERTLLCLPIPEHGAGEFPVQQRIEGDELIHGDHQPEHDLVGELRALVPEPTLGEEAAGPTADDVQGLQGKTAYTRK